jgi:hypothetical protein
LNNDFIKFITMIMLSLKEGLLDHILCIFNGVLEYQI